MSIIMRREKDDVESKRSDFDCIGLFVPYLLFSLLLRSVLLGRLIGLLTSLALCPSFSSFLSSLRLLCFLGSETEDGIYVAAHSLPCCQQRLLLDPCPAAVSWHFISLSRPLHCSS